MATVRVVAALVERSGRYLITQRRAEAVLPLLWEFPGGRVEPGESDEDALRREVRHRVGAEIGVGQLVSFVHHAYPRYAVDLYLYQCELVSQEPVALNVSAFRWVSSGQLDGYAFTPADEQSVGRLLGLNFQTESGS